MKESSPIQIQDRVPCQLQDVICGLNAPREASGSDVMWRGRGESAGDTFTPDLACPRRNSLIRGVGTRALGRMLAFRRMFVKWMYKMVALPRLANAGGVG